MNNANVARDFIDQVWNKGEFETFDRFLHPDFIDHSLPPMFTADRNGTKKWIINTGKSFVHNTAIEDQVTDGDKSIVKIKLNLTHIGDWRGIQPTGIKLSAAGYRYFKFKDGKIIAHWALIDGQAIENQLKEASLGCTIAV